MARSATVSTDSATPLDGILALALTGALLIVESLLSRSAIRAPALWVGRLIRPRNAAPINLDKCHRPFGQLGVNREARYRRPCHYRAVDEPPMSRRQAAGKRGKCEIGLSFQAVIRASPGRARSAVLIIALAYLRRKPHELSSARTFRLAGQRIIYRFVGHLRQSGRSSRRAGIARRGAGPRREFLRQ